MNLNKNFIEVFDIFTNDYKIIERKSNEKKNSKKSFLFSNMPFFRRDKSNQYNILSNDNLNYINEISETILPEEEVMPEQKQNIIPEQGAQKNISEDKKIKPKMPETSKEIDKSERTDQIKRTKTQKDEFMPDIPISQTPIQPPFPTFPPPTPPSTIPVPQPPSPIPPPARPPISPTPTPRPPMQPTPPAPRPPMQSTPPPRPPMPQPASNRAILLLTELYYDLGNLRILYLQVATYAPDINSANQLNTYANEIFILRQTILEIYRTLTGRTLPPTSNIYLTPFLTGDYCTDLGIIYNFTSSISTIILQLLRIIDINTINRQLTIILVTINNQMIGLNNLMNSCV